MSELLAEVKPEDLIKFGLIPEFVGRLPICAALGQLDRGDLMRVLTEPKNAIIRQYEKLFELEKVKLRFPDETIEAVADLAMRRDTGARGLRSILEEVMLNVMFEIPSRNDVRVHRHLRGHSQGRRTPVGLQARAGSRGTLHEGRRVGLIQAVDSPRATRLAGPGGCSFFNCGAPFHGEAILPAFCRAFPWRTPMLPKPVKTSNAAQQPLLPLKDAVVPRMVVPLKVGRPASLASVEESLAADGLFLCAQRDPNAEGRRPPNCTGWGSRRTSCKRCVPDGTMEGGVEGLARGAALLPDQEVPGRSGDCPWWSRARGGFTWCARPWGSSEYAA